MIALDASAIVAILARAPGAAALIAAIDRAKGPLIVSPLAVCEAAAGLARAKSSGATTTAEALAAARAVVDAFIEANGVREIMLTADIGRRACAAAGQFGAMVGHPAALTLEQCFAYACARAYRAELLFAETAFASTDVNARSVGSFILRTSANESIRRQSQSLRT
jgi:ribonuclease VapC